MCESSIKSNGKFYVKRYFPGAPCIACILLHILLVLRHTQCIHSFKKIYTLFRFTTQTHLNVYYSAKAQQQKQASSINSGEVYDFITHQYNTKFTNDVKSLYKISELQNDQSGAGSAGCRFINFTPLLQGDRHFAISHPTHSLWVVGVVKSVTPTCTSTPLLMV